MNKSQPLQRISVSIIEGKWNKEKILEALFVKQILASINFKQFILARSLFKGRVVIGETI